MPAFCAADVELAVDEAVLVLVLVESPAAAAAGTNRARTNNPITGFIRLSNYSGGIVATTLAPNTELPPATPKVSPPPVKLPVIVLLLVLLALELTVAEVMVRVVLTPPDVTVNDGVTLVVNVPVAVPDVLCEAVAVAVPIPVTEDKVPAALDDTPCTTFSPAAWDTEADKNANAKTNLDNLDNFI